ncbi:F0F1-type ATP synthase assembly protein I [Desulfitispora alkaliphila]|uniref:ATP synthase subunit I n=1 Tax=Desulfitispora alkaliphila TaxID=622674 RepID=UPI003D1B8407
MNRREMLTQGKLIAVTGMTIAVIAALLGYKDFSSGVLGGTAISIINMYIMYQALAVGQANPQRAQKIFVSRYIFRLVLSLAALAISAIWGVATVLGVITGLFTYILSYLPDIGRIIIGRKG